MWQQREQRERLREAGGRRIKTIYMRFSKVLPLVGAAALCIFFSIAVDPFSAEAGNLDEVDILGLAMFYAGIFMTVFAVLFFLTHYMKIYENALVCRKFFRRRILFAGDIEHISLHSLAEVPIINPRMDPLDMLAGSGLYVCIKPVEGSELRYTFRSYGAGLGAVIDWQAEQQIPDENGNLLGAE